MAAPSSVGLQGKGAARGAAGKGCSREAAGLVSGDRRQALAADLLVAESCGSLLGPGSGGGHPRVEGAQAHVLPGGGGLGSGMCCSCGCCGRRICSGPGAAGAGRCAAHPHPVPRGARNDQVAAALPWGSSFRPGARSAGGLGLQVHDTLGPLVLEPPGRRPLPGTLRTPGRRRRLSAPRGLCPARPLPGSCAHSRGRAVVSVLGTREAGELCTALLTAASLLPTSPVCSASGPAGFTAARGSLGPSSSALARGFRLPAPRRGASIAPGGPRLFAHSAANSWSSLLIF